MATMNFLADDLNPKVTSLTEDVQTTEFEWLGERYTLDLGPANRDKLQAAQDDYEAAVKRAQEKFARTWMEHAKPVDDRTPPPARKKSGNGKSHRTEPATANYLGEVRAWARAAGASIGDKGRLSGAIVDAYRAKDRSMIPAQYFPDGRVPEGQTEIPGTKPTEKPQTGPGKPETDKVEENTPAPA